MDVNGIDINVISTGSDGNAVIIENTVLVDCGVPFKALKPYMNDLRLLVLTHRHSDHFNRTTVSKLIMEKPLLRIVTPIDMVYELQKLGIPKLVSRIDLMNGNIFLYPYGNVTFRISSFDLRHDVPNVGYKITISKDGHVKRLLYATDTNSMNGVTAKGYDVYLIEANYDEDEMRQKIQEKEARGEFVYEKRVIHSHMSKQQADAWLGENADEHSQFIYMHQHRED